MNYHLPKDKEGRKLNCQKIFLKKILKKHMRKRILTEIVKTKSTHGMTSVMNAADMGTTTVLTKTGNWSATVSLVRLADMTRRNEND